MPTSTISVKYRPVRIAFLVEGGNIEDLKKAAQINTLLWWGIYNPIIPVYDNNQKHVNNFLELFNVDVFYKVSDTTNINKIIEEKEYLKDPHHIWEKLFYENWKTKKNIIAYLDSINIINFYREKEFKNKPQDYKSNCMFFERWETNKYSTLFTLMFWSYPESYNLETNFKNTFINGLKASKNVLDDELSNMEVQEYVSPIELTASELTWYWWSRNDSGIYVGSEKKFDDLIEFRNLRASWIDIEFFPLNWWTKFKDFIQKFITKIDNHPNNHPNIDEMVYVFFKWDHKAIEPIIKNFNIENKKFCYSSCSEMSRNWLNIIPNNFYLTWNQILANTEKQYNKFNVSFSLPQKSFLTDGNYHSQSLIVSIDPITEFNFPRHTLKPPFIRKLNEFYSREISIDPWKLRIESEWVGIIIRSNDSHLNLFPLSHELIIKKLFEISWFNAEVNQAGLLTQQIINKMREDNPLEACRVFKIKWVRELLRTFSANESFVWNDATKIIYENEFKKFEYLYIESRNKSKLTTKSVFNFLIKKRIFKPKVKLLHKLLYSKEEFKCRNCWLKENIRLKNYENNWICPYCENVNFMPQYIGEDLHGKVNKYFTFSKTWLFSKNNNQEGAIPVIITLLTLSRILDNRHNFFYIPSLNIKWNSIKCEIDFTVINYSWNKIEIGISECKSKWKQEVEEADINQNDIRNLESIQEELNKSWFDCYLIFSKTTEKFKDSELKLFKDLKSKKKKLILLTNNEIEPYNPYWELEKTDALPRKYAISMEDMYLNTLYLYLND